MSIIILFDKTKESYRWNNIIKENTLIKIINSMNQNIWCKFFGIHKYEVLKEEELRNAHGILVGKVIISRCNNCGKIKSIKIYTETGYGRE